MCQGKRLVWTLNYPTSLLPPSTSQASPPQVPSSQCLKNIFWSVWKVFLFFWSCPIFLSWDQQHPCTKPLPRTLILTLHAETSFGQRMSLSSGFANSSNFPSQHSSLLTAQGPEDRGYPFKISKEQRPPSGICSLSFLRLCCYSKAKPLEHLSTGAPVRIAFQTAPRAETTDAGGQPGTKGPAAARFPGGPDPGLQGRESKWALHCVTKTPTLPKCFNDEISTKLRTSLNWT